MLISIPTVFSGQAQPLRFPALVFGECPAVSGMQLWQMLGLPRREEIAMAPIGSTWDGLAAEPTTLLRISNSLRLASIFNTFFFFFCKSPNPSQTSKKGSVWALVTTVSLKLGFGLDLLRIAVLNL